MATVSLSARRRRALAFAGARRAGCREHCKSDATHWRATDSERRAIETDCDRDRAGSPPLVTDL
eukprot:6027061-Prymnesium_polylepis.1